MLRRLKTHEDVGGDSPAKMNVVGWIRKAFQEVLIPVAGKTHPPFPPVRVLTNVRFAAID
jgi:hypothetical protein